MKNETHQKHEKIRPLDGLRVVDISRAMARETQKWAPARRAIQPSKLLVRRTDQWFGAVRSAIIA